MKVTTSAMLGFGLTVQQAMATGWTDAPSFNCPSNTNNQCNQQQSSGFDWSGLQPGSFSSYGGLGFNGFECKDSSSLKKRNGFGGSSKCIAGGVSSGSGPGISCGSEQPQGMAIKGFHLSSDQDTDVDCVFHQPGGSTCTQRAHCNSGGSYLNNDQCAGATSVSFTLPSTATHSCSLSVHSISFDCSTASSTVPVSYSTPATYSTPSAYTTPQTTPQSVPSYSIPSSSYGINSSPSQSIPVQSIPSSSYGINSSPSQSIPSYSAANSTQIGSIPNTPATTPATTPVSSGVTTPVTTPIIGSSSVPETLTTVIVQTTLTTCPVGQTVTQSGSTTILSTPSISTIYSTSTSTICTKCTAFPSGYTPSGSVPSGSAPVGSAPVGSVSGGLSSYSSPSAPAPSAPAPSLLPQCLNTWLWMSGCKDNADSSCICGNSAFQTKVVNCVDAYGSDDNEKTLALNFFAGICAPHNSIVPIVTACPSTITIGSTPSPSAPAPGVPSSPAPGVPSSAGASVPVYSSEAVPTPETVYSTQEITITSCGPEVTNCPASSTVVQTTSVPVSVIPASSPAVPSSAGVSTPASVPVSSPIVAPSPSTVYSTQEITITSCGPEVTNCPASSTVVQTTSVPVSVVPVSVPSSAGVTVPASSVPVGSAPASYVPGSSSVASVYVPGSSSIASVPASYAPGSSPVVSPPASYVPGSSPASAGYTVPTTPAPASSQPQTTVTVSTSVVVPCTYSTGESAGNTIPASSSTSSLTTTLTIPQVQFTTATVTSAGQVSTSAGLAAGTPNAASAGATTYAGSAVPTSFTSVVSGVAGQGTGVFPKVTPTAKPSTSAPIPGNASAGVQISANGFLVSAIMAAAVALFM